MANVNTTNINTKVVDTTDEDGIELKVTNPQDDGDFSSSLLGHEEYVISPTDSSNASGNIYKSIYNSSGIYDRTTIRNTLYNKTFRFGHRDPYRSLSVGREYLFFTKPDLHIMKVDEHTHKATNKLNDSLASIPFWIDLSRSRVDTIRMLQNSFKDQNDIFNHLLQNQVKSNLDIPGLSSEYIDTPTNTYGTNYSYRGSSEASDDNPEFSLEFKDNKYLDTYYFFKAYEEYQTLKHHGVIKPPNFYITGKVLHDQFAIYKFIVDEDMETIIYYGKMYGVTPKSLPRDVFSSPTFDDGLSYSIDFKAAFYEDMKPDILSDFNKLSGSLYNSQKYQITPYNPVLDHADMRPAKAAAVITDRKSAAAKASPTGYVYKLKWRGSDKY